VRERGLDPVIEVDGGENETTAGQAAAAGATAIVAGSAIFGTKDYKAAIAAIRASATRARSSHERGRSQPTPIATR
jgi:ribulose-phosphate 3-epimerase